VAAALAQKLISGLVVPSPENQVAEERSRRCRLRLLLDSLAARDVLTRPSGCRTTGAMSPSAAAVQVSLTGWLAYVVALAVVVSMGLSLLAVRFATDEAQRTRAQAAAAAAEARVEAARERRLQYELGVLADMSRQHGITGMQHLGGSIRSLIRADSPDEDLPLLRVVEDVFPTHVGEKKSRAIEEQIEGEGLAARGTRDSRRSRAVGREIEDAIDRRMAL